MYIYIRQTNPLYGFAAMPYSKIAKGFAWYDGHRLRVCVGVPKPMVLQAILTNMAALISHHACTRFQEAHMYDLFEDLLLKMLAFDPDLRISPADALKHPFFTAARYVCDPRYAHARARAR
jgi:serine/threonine protein kinase